MLPKEGADDLQGDGVDALVSHLAGLGPLRGDELVQLLLAEGLVPGEGRPAGGELLQRGLEPVVVKGLDEVVGHPVGVELRHMMGLAGGSDHDDVRQKALRPELGEEGPAVHDGHIVVQKDQVHRVGPDELHGLLAVGKGPGDGQLRIVPGVLPDDLRDHGVVFHDDDLIHTASLARRSFPYAVTARLLLHHYKANQRKTQQKVLKVLVKTFQRGAFCRRDSSPLGNPLSHLLRKCQLPRRGSQEGCGTALQQKPSPPAHKKQSPSKGQALFSD